MSARQGLVGHSGFVGTTLKKQTQFEAQFRSTDIASIRGQSFDLLVIAGAPAQKWLANREPEADRARIEGLMAQLQTVSARRVVLISTVDVFSSPIAVDEETPVHEAGLQPYGLNRRRLERFVTDWAPQPLVVRLPGLVGPGLRKNVLYDFQHNNNLDAIDHRGVFQFYPMVNLWSDITTALKANLSLVHLTAEPISVADVAQHGFGRSFANTTGTVARYDFRTRHASLFGGEGTYQYARRETLMAIRAYAQSEPQEP
jgi:hypothetical protein